MFSNAKSISTPTPPAKGKKQTIEVKGVEQLAMVNALTKALETVEATLVGEVKGAASAIFQAHIAQYGSKPESFNAVEGDATANVQFKKRGTNMALHPAEVELLRSNGIEPAREVTTPRLFAINPVYAEDAELLARVEVALVGVVPQDFIVLQEEKAKHTVSDEVIIQVCSKRLAPEVIGAVFTLACKPTLKETNINRLLDFTRDLLTAPAPAAAANQEAA